MTTGRWLMGTGYAVMAVTLTLGCAGPGEEARPAGAPANASATAVAGAGEVPATGTGAGNAVAGNGAGDAAAGSAAAPKSGAPAAGAPVLATDSAPEGTEPLDEAESKELASRCKPLSAAVAKAAQGDPEGGSSTERVLRALARPPQIAGVDVPRCARLMERAVRLNEARALESEPMINIRRIVFALSSAEGGEPPRLCPSAPPVPTDLRQLERAPYRSTAADWQGEGWRCVRFELVGVAQRFQYELRTDPKAGSYEIVARGYSVPGHGPTELYLAGKVEGGAIQPTSAVYRRR